MNNTPENLTTSDGCGSLSVTAGSAPSGEICERCGEDFGFSGQDANGWNSTCVHCGHNIYIASECGCENGIVRSLGRDNDAIIEGCPRCSKPNPQPSRDA